MGARPAGSARAMPELPINTFRDQIVETVRRSPVAVLIGATGSGKSTQLAQMLLAAGVAGDGAICVTQPRRVAAVSVARRVAQEMGVQVGQEVGYTVRFEDCSCARTRILFQTDGMLVREMLRDPLLRRYSVVILDEAHERSLNTDILFGLLKDLVARRQDPLKLVITSATLDSDKFSAFFGACPVIDVPGKLFPVEVFYSTERPASYFDSAVETTLSLHESEEPEGDILVFLTGQDEISRAVAALEDRIRTMEEGACPDAIVLPLHASLPPEQQARIFAPAPPGCRRIIVATNVAETAITVDGVVCVVDPGYVKQRTYDPTSQLSSLSVVPISRVQAIQRAGRAGRTRRGKCFRLYPKAVFEHELEGATVPEIQRSSLAATVLHLKSLGHAAASNVLHFDFLDPPSSDALQDALRQLYALGCIDAAGKVTALGREACELPLDPPLACTLLAAISLGCVDEAAAVAAMLSSDAVWSMGGAGGGGGGKGGGRGAGEERRGDGHARVALPDGDGFGDHIRFLQILQDWQAAGYSAAWCKERGLQLRSMNFIKDVARQLRGAIQQRMKKGSAPASEGGAAGTPYGNELVDILRESERGGSGRKRPRLGSNFVALRLALCFGSANKIAQRMANRNGYKTVNDRPRLVELHPSCAPLRADEDGLLPEWVVYHEILATSRPFMRGVCAVEPRWLRPLLPRLQDVNVQKLSGVKPREAAPKSTEAAPDKGVVDVGSARERFLARKLQKKKT